MVLFENLLKIKQVKQNNIEYWNTLSKKKNINKLCSWSGIIDDGTPATTGTTTGRIWIDWFCLDEAGSPRALVGVVSDIGKAFGEISWCSTDDVGRDVRLFCDVGDMLPVCCDGVWLVIPTCKGLNESSNPLVRPFISSVSIQTKKNDIFKTYL